jgi:hypothetical protein
MDSPNSQNSSTTYKQDSRDFRNFCESFHYILKNQEIISAIENEIAQSYFESTNDFYHEMTEYLNINNK